MTPDEEGCKILRNSVACPAVTSATDRKQFVGRQGICSGPLTRYAYPGTPAVVVPDPFRSSRESTGSPGGLNLGRP
eukprot:3123232-Rhodomonas_salina.4